MGQWSEGIPSVRGLFSGWLTYLRRELDALEDAGDQDDPPEWLSDFFSRAKRARGQAQDVGRPSYYRLDEVGQLLWQTGTPLECAVRDAFKSAGLEAELAEPNTTYDVDVSLDDGRRLLVEVTDINGGISKSSNKISQVLAAIQNHAGDGDRVVLVANVYRKSSPDARLGQEALTKEAHALIVGLKVVFVTTTTLFAMWRLAQQDPKAAKAQVVALHGAAPGVFEMEDLRSPEPSVDPTD